MVPFCGIGARIAVGLTHPMVSTGFLVVGGGPCGSKRPYHYLGGGPEKGGVPVPVPFPSLYGFRAVILATFRVPVPGPG